MLERPVAQRVAVGPGPGHQDLAGVADLQGQRGVEHVGGRQAVVDPAPLLPDRRRDDVDEGRDVVVRRALALGDRLDFERGSLPAGRRGLGGDHALGRPGVGRGQLHGEPALHPAAVRPDRPYFLTGVARDQALMILAASRPAFFDAVDRHAAHRHARGHLDRGEQRVEAAEALAEDRHADHGQVGVRRGDARQRRGHAGAGDDHPEPAHPRGVAVLADLLRVAVGAHHPDLVADAGVLQRLAGGLHLGLVVLRAHDDPDARRVDLDLLERGLDLGHRLRAVAAGSRSVAVSGSRRPGSAVSISSVFLSRWALPRDALDRAPRDVLAHLHSVEADQPRRLVGAVARRLGVAARSRSRRARDRRRSRPARRRRARCRRE